jgi:hypothetical protein
MSEDNFKTKPNQSSNDKKRKNSVLTNHQGSSFEQYLSVGNLKKDSQAASKRNMNYSTNMTSNKANGDFVDNNLWNKD